MKFKKILINVIVLLSFNINVSAQCGMPDVLLFGTTRTNISSTPYWVAVPGAISYNFRYRQRNAGLDYSNPVNTTSTSYTLTGLIPLTNYEFIVQSECSGDTSAYSPSGWFTTLSSAAPQITRGPFMTVPSESKITVQWSTGDPCNSEVRYGTAENNLDKTISSASINTNHEITITDLLPNTKYYYSVGITGLSLQASPQNYFYSAPAENDSVPIRFWVTGDFGTGTTAQRNVRDAFVNFIDGEHVNGWLWLGDNAYSSGHDDEFQDKVFDVYPSQFKNIPVYPALGNHDYAESGYLSTASRGINFPYFSIFSLPASAGTEKYYSANYGNVHLIALDSYGSYNTVGSPMYNWLENDLINNNLQWTIVYFHHAPYSKGSHDSDDADEMVDMRNNIIPLLESHGVDLVLSGHSHAYERSKFIHGHYGVESTFNSSHLVQPGGGPYSKTTRKGAGTVYVVCGVSAQMESTASGWPHAAMQYSTATVLGSLIIDVQGGDLTCSFLTSAGIIGDQFSVSKPSMAVPINTGIDIPDIKNQFYIAPNPAKDEFGIYSSNMTEGNFIVNIYSAQGQLVFNKSVMSDGSNRVATISRQEIDCAAGIYYIVMQNEKVTEVCPVVLE